MEVDDFVVDTIDGPIVVIATVLGLLMAVQTLTLPQGVRDAVQAAMVRPSR